MTATPFQETIVELTRQIDNLLFKLGGSGRNFHERAASLRHVLNAQEARRLCLVDKVNHRMIYRGRFTIRREHHRFIRICGWMIYRLETHLATRAQRQMKLWGRTNFLSQHLFAIGAGVLGVSAAVSFFTNFTGHGGWIHSSIQTITAISSVVALSVVMFVTNRYILKRR